jgi:hypothetical protein
VVLPKNENTRSIAKRWEEGVGQDDLPFDSWNGKKMPESRTYEKIRI